MAIREHYHIKFVTKQTVLDYEEEIGYFDSEEERIEWDINFFHKGEKALQWFDLFELMLTALSLEGELILTKLTLDNTTDSLVKPVETFKQHKIQKKED